MRNGAGNAENQDEIEENVGYGDRNVVNQGGSEGDKENQGKMLEKQSENYLFFKHWDSLDT